MRHCQDMFERRQLDDPMLRFSEQLESNARESFCETVNVAPMFTATAAAGRALSAEPPPGAKFALQLENADRLARHASRTGWRVLRPKSSLRCGSCFSRHKVPRRRQPRSMRCEQHFAGPASP